MQKICLTLLALCVSLITWANPVDVEAANEIAERFLKSRTEAVNAAQGLHRDRSLAEVDMKLVYASATTASNTSAEYYVFTPAESEGFVIVSGEDQMPPIVGYSLTDKFSPQQMPPALKNLLSMYAQYVSDVRTGKVAPASLSEETVTPVFPFITTTWNQYAPYNIYCPEIDGQSTLTGCVATATAQIMNYYEWPRAGHGTCTATLNDGNNTPVTTTLNQEYDWANMKDDYASSSYTDLEAQAVGQLMKDVGYACQLSYGVDFTSGYTSEVLMALLRNFDYSPDAYIIDKEYYSIDAWRELIHGELLAGRPIWYRGEGSGGGHAFVCCGMDQQGAYYINWGWGGWSDGYFYLDALLDYTSWQQAVIGIKPIEEGESPSDYVPMPHIGRFEILEQGNSQDAPSVVVDFKVNNLTADTISGYVGYALYEDGEMISADVTDTYVHFAGLWPNYWYGYTSTVRLDNVSDLSPKEREIRFFWRYEGSDEWVDALGDQCVYMNTTADGHHFYLADNTVEYTEAVLTDGNYYLQNAATGQFLLAANDWGTRASVGPHGLDLLISKLPNGKYTLDTQISNSGTQHFLGDNGQGALFMDVAETEWTIGVLENGNYVFTIDSGLSYMGARGSVVYNLKTNPMDDEALQWRLLSRADMMAELNHATISNPVDATFFIAGANFGRSDARNAQWTGVTSMGGEYANYCSEKWSVTPYDVYQILTDLPNGLYELRVQGFYREGGANTPLKAAENYAAGRSELNAILYANGQSVPLPSIMSEAKEGQAPNVHFYTTSMGYVPQDMTGASNFFSEGLYQTSLQCEVTDGTLHLGVKKEQGANYDWSCFDNFELYYCGTSFALHDDQLHYANIEERTFNKIVYSREFNNTSWQSLYVPFEIPYESIKDDFVAGYINNIHQFDDDDDGTIDRTQVEVIKLTGGTLKANYPYLIRAKSTGSKMISVPMATLYATEENSIDCSSVFDTYTFTGTYSTLSSTDLPQSEGYYALSDGVWRQLAPSATLGAFRVYMKVDSRGHSATVLPRAIEMRVIGDDEEGTTAIPELESAAKTLQAPLIYDLQGRRVEKASKGLYIINGQKVLIK